MARTEPDYEQIMTEQVGVSRPTLNDQFMDMLSMITMGGMGNIIPKIAKSAKLKRVLKAGSKQADNYLFGDLGGGLKTEIIQNPRTKDYQTISKEFKRRYPNAPKGEPYARKTFDREGNIYIWRADTGTHEAVEHLINKKFNTITNQNQLGKMFFDD